MNELIVFGYGHLAKFLPGHINDQSITATKTNIDEKIKNINLIKFNLGDEIPNSVSCNPSAVIWTIPPRENSLETLKKADQYFNKVVPWIFISSTSVYKQGHVNEDCVLDGDSVNAKILIEIEAFLSTIIRKVAVIRPGGLVDEHRHPAKYLSQKSKVDAGLNPVNLVHTKDVAKFICYLLKNNQYLGTYNLVSDTHISKKDYYQPFIKEYFKKDVEFLNSSTSSKIVENSKSKSIGFKYDHLDVSFSNLKLFFF